MKDRTPNVQDGQDVIWDTIYGVPHPDPRMRPARLSIHIPSLFWGRVRRHLQRCQALPERMLWELWLTPQAVRAILSAGSAPPLRHGLNGPSFAESRTAELSITRSITARPRHVDRSGSGSIAPETAIQRLRQMIGESLQYPLSLRLDPEPAGLSGSPAADPIYLLVLTNGATLVLRIDDANKPSRDNMISARLDDCFFTRAAADFARLAGDLGLETSGTANPAASTASSSRLLHISAEPSSTVVPGHVRGAVAGEWVGRYAVAIGEEKLPGLVPPDRPCDVNGYTEQRHAHFLHPTAWGFSGGAHGCVWVGFDSTSAIDALGGPDTETLRRRFEEHASNQTNRLQSNANERNADPTDFSSTDRNPTNPTRTEPLFHPRLTLPRHRLPLSDDADPSLACISKQTRSCGEVRPRVNDALACLPELGRAMAECRRAWAGMGGEPGAAKPASAGRPAAAAAYRAAVALGRCRLVGAERADATEFTLSPAVAVSAARELAGRIKQWARQARSLPADMRGATAPRASDLCMGLLEARLEAWAAYVAVDESYSAAVDEADESAEAFSHEIDGVLDGLQGFDDLLQWAEPLVASVISVPGARLLDNWKSLLAAPYRQSPPWWLDCVAEANTD